MGHMVILFFIFLWETCHIGFHSGSVSSAQWLEILYILTNTYSCFFFFFLIVTIVISDRCYHSFDLRFSISDVEHLYVLLGHLCVSSLGGEREC